MESSMLSIFEYLDYREFLRDFYREQKRLHFYFSFRFLAQKTNVDPAHIARVFQCKRHLSETSLAPFIALCKFNHDEKAYFDQLVSFNRAKTGREASRAFESLLSLSSVKTQTLRQEQYGFYSKWYYTAVRALIAMKSFSIKDASKIARMLSPSITVTQAKEAITSLVKLGLVRKGINGNLALTELHITTGPQWRSLAAGEFQADTMRLALESLERHKKEVRDISTVTIGIKKNRMPEIRQRIAEFRKSIIHLAQEDQDPDDVYQFNIQLFPLTDTSKEGQAS
jgi:uncharacterized protein (TIGR02147 family)